MNQAEAIADDAEARARYELSHRGGGSTYVRSSKTRFLLLRFGYRMGGRWVWQKRNGKDISRDEAIAIIARDRGIEIVL